MLDLHRASAGSGKTYTLAKKFIWYLVTIKEEDRPRRLRRDSEIADSARHILAVTFTNKATNEMQQRIVKRLDDLAHMTPVYGLDDTGRRVIKSPDYMQEFCDDLRVSPARLAEVCAKALSALLENYSDFKVSTIDSFFQLVLRTFAYESELNDSYQIELDSEYLSQMAVDSMLEAFDSDEDKKDAHSAREISEAVYWVGRLMEGADKAWNIFARKINARNDDAPYKSLIKSVKRLENEDYKTKRKVIEDYYASERDLIADYETLSRHFEAPVKEAFEQFVASVRKLKKQLPLNILDKGQAGRDLKALLTRLIDYAGAKKHKATDAPDEKISGYFDKVLEPDAKAKMMKKFGAGSPWIVEALPHCHECFCRWTAELSDPDFRTWRVYARNLPYFALFGIINRKRLEFLAETNSVELGETSMILREVINDSDAPFVYERLGAVLNHFLIDEFQDTSKLQWENLRPLLDESMSRDNESLIIGDAKQSIYRFRNADSSLITSVVPTHFAGRVNTRGTLPQDNKNFRSELHIVQFNNSFFEYLVHRLDTAQNDNPDRQIFKRLYENVVQLPSRAEAARGYVRLTLAGENQEDFKSRTLAHIPKLIHELLERGYEQKDIAILVYAGSEGSDVIDSILRYNIEYPDFKPISFVSEQSLLVKNSEAVKMIVGVLRNMARGFNPRLNPCGERRKKGVGRWAEMETRFKFFTMGRSGSKAELLDEFIQAEPELDSITSMLDGLNSLSIPAIVEAVVASFMPDSLRKSDAVFIAAFQDIVLEYCERRPTDIGSFLEWWERRSQKAAISSPEGVDAVQILTYHKSKGLEYDCVIIPFADWNMSDFVESRKVEWRWLEPAIALPEGVELPPYVPVNIDRELMMSAHESALLEFYDELKTDFLNQAYVAFTRASKELYVFSGGKKVSGASGPDAGNYSSFAGYLRDFAEGKGGNTGAEDVSRLDTDGIKLTCPDDDKSPVVAEFGIPYADVMADKDREHRKEQGDEKLTIGEYRSTLISDLSIRQDDLPLSMDNVECGNVECCPEEGAAGTAPETGEDVGDEIDLDPRSEGNIKHAVLEMVRVPEDLPRAVRHLTVTGLLLPELAAEIEADLALKLKTPGVAEWFDGTARVVNERSLLQAGHVTRRPDRILIYPDGRAVVVDYKFGAYPGSKKYRHQIRRYVNMLRRTGDFTSVAGFLWFVNDNTIESHTGKIVPTAT